MATDSVENGFNKIYTVRLNKTRLIKLNIPKLYCSVFPYTPLGVVPISKHCLKPDK